jgi:hypothetical protein
VATEKNLRHELHNQDLLRHHQLECLKLSFEELSITDSRMIILISNKTNIMNKSTSDFDSPAKLELVRMIVSLLLGLIIIFDSFLIVIIKVYHQFLIGPNIWVNNFLM